MGTQRGLYCPGYQPSHRWQPQHIGGILIAHHIEIGRLTEIDLKSGIKDVVEGLGFPAFGDWANGTPPTGGDVAIRAPYGNQPGNQTTWQTTVSYFPVTLDPSAGASTPPPLSPASRAAVRN